MKSCNIYNVTGINHINCQQILAADGPFADLIDGFQARQVQKDLAEAVTQSIEQRQVLIAEAGTGTGKTLAYLIPALLSGLKVSVATGTKNLQDQLFKKDLPLVAKALKKPLQAALLKGRSNYLCRYRIAVNTSGGQFISHDVLQDFNYIQDNLASSNTGDIAEFSNVAEDSLVWPYVTSTVDNCLGNDCEFYDTCFLVSARRQAQKADLVVINHHLFCADLVLKEDGFGELLPSAQLTIFDEAHQLPEIATQFFGKRLSSRQLIELARDVVIETKLAAADQKKLLELAASLEQTTMDFRLTLGKEPQRSPWFAMLAKPEVGELLLQLTTVMNFLQEELASACERSDGIANCYRRSLELAARFKLFITEQIAGDQSQILWIETYTKSFSLNATPLSVAGEFNNALLARETNYIFTSATLAVNNEISHFANSLGLTNYQAKIFASPFNYQTQTILYLPRGIPDYKDPDYIAQLVATALPIVKALNGRCFFLFTSYRALNAAAILLAEELDLPLLIQGTKAKAQLLAEFKLLGNAVLLGTSSFWEGVDVKGQVLACVIIDKLPFASPFEPIIQARIKHIRQVMQQDPFATYQLPKAVISLKQGVGRLIRDAQDRGILMIGDPRLTGRNYGEQFFNSLPVMHKSRELQNVLQFICEAKV